MDHTEKSARTMDHTEKSARTMDQTEMSSIQDLSFDALKNIMMLVIPETPSSGFEMFNTFLVCNAFQELSYNKSILKILVFEDLAKYSLKSCDSPLMIQWQKCNSPNLSTHFQAFHCMGGFILRASKAGNLSARRNLGKLIIRCASVLFWEKNETSPEMPPEESDRLSTCEKASSLLAYITTENTGASPCKELLHSELVKEYLFTSKLEEVQEMMGYIEDYVKYFRDPIVEVHPTRYHVMIEHSDEIFTRALERAYDNAVEAAQATLSSAMRNMMSSKIHRATSATSIHMECYSLMLITQHYKSLHWIEHFICFDEFLKEGSIEVALPGYNELEENRQNTIYVPLAWFLEGWYMHFYGVQGGDPQKMAISRVIEQIYMVRKRLLRLLKSIIRD